MEKDNEIPVNGFICDAVCPNCNTELKANVPAKPTDSDWIKARQRCPKCGHDFLIYRYKDGSWVITN
jgi:DNA-directed RNA polymerase subunit RPC12/RpoP